MTQNSAIARRDEEVKAAAAQEVEDFAKKIVDEGFVAVDDLSAWKGHIASGYDGAHYGEINGWLREAIFRRTTPEQRNTLRQSGVGMQQILGAPIL